MQDYRNLKVWQKAHEIVLDVYRVTGEFPDDERFGLISQMRRCAVSVPSNIAEGTGRVSDADFKRFIHISIGSAAELDYQLMLSRDLSYLSDAEYRSIHENLSVLRRMLTAFSKRLK